MGSPRNSLSQAAGRKPQAPARGAVLLEVLIALALLIFGLAVIGLQVNKGLDAARVADIGTKGVMLAETKMAELNSGVIKPEDNNDEIKGDFGMVYPGYTWRFKFQPTEVNDFLAVELNIGHSGKQAKAQLDNPDQQIDFDEEGVRVVESIYRLVPIPADVNFERDFGFTQEEMQNAQAQADQQGAGGAAGTGGDGQSGGQAGGFDMSQLLAVLGPYLSTGFDPRMLANLPAEQLAQVQPFLQALLGNGKMDAKGPLDSIFQGGGRGRFGRGPRGGRDGNGPPGGNAGDRNGGENNGNNANSNNNGNDTGRTRTRRNPDDAGPGNNSNSGGSNSGNDNGNGNTGNGTRRGRTRTQNNSSNSNDSGSNGSNNSSSGSNNRRSGRNQNNNSSQSR